MSHTYKNKDKLVARAGRIKGQLGAVEKSLEQGDDCSKVLHIISAARGALDSLLVEILEDHVREHIVDPDDRPESQRSRATQDLLDILRAYFK